MCGSPSAVLHLVDQVLPRHPVADAGIRPSAREDRCRRERLDSSSTRHRKASDSSRHQRGRPAPGCSRRRAQDLVGTRDVRNRPSTAETSDQLHRALGEFEQPLATEFLGLACASGDRRDSLGAAVLSGAKISARWRPAAQAATGAAGTRQERGPPPQRHVGNATADRTAFTARPSGPLIRSGLPEQPGAGLPDPPQARPRPDQSRASRSPPKAAAAAGRATAGTSPPRAPRSSFFCRVVLLVAALAVFRRHGSREGCGEEARQGPPARLPGSPAPQAPAAPGRPERQGRGADEGTPSAAAWPG